MVLGTVSMHGDGAGGFKTDDLENPHPVGDSGEFEFLHETFDVTASGDTPLITPTAGKKIRIRWLYAINDPNASSAVKMKFRFAENDPFYNVWALAKRQIKTGGTDEVLKVNLSGSGDVAITVIYEEID